MPNVYSDACLYSTENADTSFLLSMDYTRDCIMDWRRLSLILLWLNVHLLHWGLLIGFIVSCIFNLIYSPWYVCIPFIIILGNPILGGAYCVYNNLENKYRAQLGWPLIEHNFSVTIIQEILSFIRRKLR